MIASEPDPGGHLTEQGGAFVGSLAEAIGLSNGGQEWGGLRWTTLVWPLPAGVSERRRLLAHELFHVLANNGEHVDIPANLMQGRTRPDGTLLNAKQCETARLQGLRHGLLTE